MTQWMLKIVLVIVLLYVLYTGLPLFVTRVLRLGAWRRGLTSGKVALTFDDGPDARYTGDILDILREQNVPATFFVIAQKARECSEVVKRMKSDGHEVEVHGFTHAMVPLLTPRKAIHQITKSRAILAELGISAKYYRPTWGMCNLASLVWLKIHRDMKLVTWSVMVGDWRRTEPIHLIQRILHGIHNGAIIVLHDSDATWGAEHGATAMVVEALPELIKEVKRAGYKFVRLDELETQRA